MYLTVQTIKQIVLIHENAKVIIDSEDVWCEIAVARASSDCQQQSQCRASLWFVSAVLGLFVHTYICRWAFVWARCSVRNIFVLWENKYNHTTKTKSSLSLGCVSFSVLVSLQCLFLLLLLPQQTRFIWNNSSNFVGKKFSQSKKKRKKLFLSHLRSGFLSIIWISSLLDKLHNYLRGY